MHFDAAVMVLCISHGRGALHATTSGASLQAAAMVQPLPAQSPHLMLGMLMHSPNPKQVQQFPVPA